MAKCVKINNAQRNVIIKATVNFIYNDCERNGQKRTAASGATNNIN